MKRQAIFYKILSAVILLVVVGCGGAEVASNDSYSLNADLIFDGENDSAVPILFRIALNENDPMTIGTGIPGRNPSSDSDGQTLVFQSNGSEMEPSRLLLLKAGTDHPVPFEGGTQSIEREAALSPDNSHIAFTAFRDDERGDIFTADIRGTQLENLRNLTLATSASNITDATPAWSPDGRRIAFTSYRNRFPAIWVMDADGSNPKQITREDGLYSDYFPSWSPEGKWIAFQRNDLTQVRIGIIAAEGGEPRFLSWKEKAYTPAWSPDGNHIAFSARGDSGDMDIFVVDLEGRQTAHIRRQGDDRNPAWIIRKSPFSSSATRKDND
jgi:TolB protein